MLTPLTRLRWPLATTDTPPMNIPAPPPLDPTSPTGMLPVAGIWPTLLEPSTWLRERLRLSQKVRKVRWLSQLSSTTPMELRLSTTPPTTALTTTSTTPPTTASPLPTPGASTSLLTTTLDTSPSMARER